MFLRSGKTIKMDKINVVDIENVHEQQIDGEDHVIEGNDNTQVEAPQANQAPESANAGIQSPDSMAVIFNKFMDQLKNQMKEQSDEIKNQMKEQSNDIEDRLKNQMKNQSNDIEDRLKNQMKNQSNEIKDQMKKQSNDI